MVTLTAGCTSTSVPSATDTSTTVVVASPSLSPSSAPVSTPASTPASSVSPTASPLVQPSVSASAAPALDAASKAWFSAGCTGQKDLQKLASPKTSGTVSELQAQVAAAYLALSASAARTAKTLKTLPAPSMPQGSKVQQVRAAVFQAISVGYGQGATIIKNTPFTTTAELNAAVEKIEAGIQSTVGKVAATAPKYPDGYSALILALPACSGLS